MSRINFPPNPICLICKTNRQVPGTGGACATCAEVVRDVRRERFGDR